MPTREKTAVIRYKASDGRRIELQISFSKNRLEIHAEVPGSDRLKKVGLETTLGITTTDWNKDDMEYFFYVLNS